MKLYTGLLYVCHNFPLVVHARKDLHVPAKLHHKPLAIAIATHNIIIFFLVSLRILVHMIIAYV